MTVSLMMPNVLLCGGPARWWKMVRRFPPQHWKVRRHLRRT